jgi:hypothetical protein
MNALIAGLVFLIMVSVIIYILMLAGRLVKAVEEIANKLSD